MLKKLLATFCAFLLLMGCNANKQFNPKEAIEELYSVPYKNLITIKDSAKNKEDFYKGMDNAIKEEFTDLFNEDTINKHLSENTFLFLNEYVLENKGDVSINSIDISETGERQYAYTITFNVKNLNDITTDESIGTISFDEDNKIISWNVIQFPSFSHLN